MLSRLVFSLRPEFIWFSPASVYVWLLNSQMSDEQKELQQTSSLSAHTCHNRGPTPHYPNNESAKDRKIKCKKTKHFLVPVSKWQMKHKWGNRLTHTTDDRYQGIRFLRGLNGRWFFKWKIIRRQKLAFLNMLHERTS